MTDRRTANFGDIEVKMTNNGQHKVKVIVLWNETSSAENLFQKYVTYSVLQNPQKNDLDPDPILWQKMDLDPNQIRSFYKGSRSRSRSFSRSFHDSPLRHRTLEFQKLQNKGTFLTILLSYLFKVSEEEKWSIFPLFHSST